MKIKYLLIISLFLSNVAYADPLPDKPHVYVEGSASIEVVPDTITFTVEIAKVDMDMGTAKEDVDSRSRVLIETCRELGLKDESISTTTLSVRPNYEYQDRNRIPRGTRVSRQIDVKVTNLDLYPSIMSVLVKANISETIQTKLSVSQ